MNATLQSLMIRNATTMDTESLINLRKLLLNQGTGHYAAQSLEEELAWQENYKQWLIKNLDNNKSILVIVSCDSETKQALSGCAIGIIDERVPFKGCLNARMGWIQTVVVHPDFRRKGIAEGMMHYLFNWFRSNDVGKVSLQTTAIAKPLYEKLDFLDSGEVYLIKTL